MKSGLNYVRLVLLAVIFEGLLIIGCSTNKDNEYKGKIVDVTSNKKIYRAGDNGQFYVEFINDSPKKRHYLIAMEITDSNNNCIYDSHNRSKDTKNHNDNCKDVWLEPGQSAKVGPYKYKFSSSNNPGTYSMITSVRIYPWEPVVEFRGADWCPPKVTFKFRR